MYKQLTYLILAGLVTGISPAQASQVHHWKLDDAGAVAVDSVGGLNGDIQGATSVPGKSGNALSFDGTDDVVTIAGFVPPPQGTIAFWINPVMAKNKERILGAGGDYEVWLRSNGELKNELFDNGSSTTGTGAGVLTANEWHHVAMTYDSATGDEEIYYDGELMVAGKANVPSTPTETTLVVGHRGGASAAEHYGGLLDDLRIYDHVLSQAEVRALANPPRAKARDPIPADGSVYEQLWVNLGWTAGDFAVSHDVYLGNSFDDVNDGTRESPTFWDNQPGTELLAGFSGYAFPEGLVPGTTYYWRVDEVNESEPNSPWKGDTWNFRLPPTTAYNPEPADGAGYVDPNAVFTWKAGLGAVYHTFYIGNSFDDVNDAADGVSSGIAAYSPGPLELEKVYYWRIDEFDGSETHKGEVWAFTTPGAVGNPQPPNGAVDVPMNSVLSWTAAENAASHELFFGTNSDAVRNATKASPEYLGPRALGAASHDSGGLDWGTAYAWRVDEVYPTETVKGLVWTFTTADFIIVEDFESYDDIDPLAGDPGHRIFDKWVDGYGTTTNGALTAEELPPYAEQTVVHSGGQSMKYRYDTNLEVCESTLTLDYPKDWTEGDAARLSLWFKGDSSNATERMYIALNGSAVVYHDDPAATQVTGWTEWIIELQEFADEGVDLSNVDTATIGFGTKGATTAGGTGTVYYDDIRLYR